MNIIIIISEMRNVEKKTKTSTGIAQNNARFKWQR